MAAALRKRRCAMPGTASDDGPGRVLSSLLQHLTPPHRSHDRSGCIPTSANSATGDDDVVDDSEGLVLPLFCMGDAPFEEAARDHNGYRSVALNLFEPRYCLMAKKVLAEEGADQMFGYMERVPPVVDDSEDGSGDFVGETGVRDALSLVPAPAPARLSLADLFRSSR